MAFYRISWSELEVHQFKVSGMDRSICTENHIRGGSVIIAVKNTLTSAIIASGENVEELFVEDSLRSY